MTARGLAVVLACAGCAGSLEDPSRFTGEFPVGCELSIDVETELLPVSCVGVVCHEGATPAAGLDFATPGIAGRVLDAPSTQCAGDRLADHNDPEQSLLIKKLRPDPACGDQMPLAGDPLTEQEFQCVRAWVYQVTGQ